MSIRGTPRIAVWLVLALAGALSLASGAPGQEEGIAYSIELDGTVDPASERWLASALEDAADAGAELAIVRLDTPGGLDESLREMVKSTIAAPMPVAVYVSPDGARAGSAGAYLTEAADVAAMAPQTNIGSATPISIGAGDIPKTLGRKIENDAAAYMRALAGEHGRNAGLAEEMVTEARNFTAEEALDRNLIDVIAADERQLLERLDGFRVEGPKAQALRTAELRIERHEMPLQYELLQIVVNPTVAYLLLVAGLGGLALELLSGGSTIAPGVLGAIALLLGLYGTAQLPVTFAGIALLLGGVALIVAEAHLPTHGVLGAGGTGALAFSGLLLYDTGSAAFEVSAPVVIVVGLLTGGFVALAAQKVIAARRRPVRTGWEEMIGATGEVRAALSPVGQVFVEGALWRARAASGDGSIERGARVRVEAVDGLTLLVEPEGEGGAGIESGD